MPFFSIEDFVFEKKISNQRNSEMRKKNHFVKIKKEKIKIKNQ